MKNFNKFKNVKRNDNVMGKYRILDKWLKGDAVADDKALLLELLEKAEKWYQEYGHIYDEMESKK